MSFKKILALYATPHKIGTMFGYSNFMVCEDLEWAIIVSYSHVNLIDDLYDDVCNKRKETIETNPVAAAIVEYENTQQLPPLPKMHVRFFFVFQKNSVLRVLGYLQISEHLLSYKELNKYEIRAFADQEFVQVALLQAMLNMFSLYRMEADHRKLLNFEQLYRLIDFTGRAPQKINLRISTTDIFSVQSPKYSITDYAPGYVYTFSWAAESI